MARPALAGIDDLNERLDAEVTLELIPQAMARLADASEIVRAYAGVTWLNTAEDAVDGVPGQIPGVVASMVERATRNPGGVVQEQAGPFGRSFGGDAASRLYMTKGEKAVVRFAAGRTAIGTLGTTRGDIETTPITDPNGAGWAPWYDDNGAPEW